MYWLCKIKGLISSIATIAMMMKIFWGAQPLKNIEKYQFKWPRNWKQKGERSLPPLLTPSLIADSSCRTTSINHYCYFVPRFPGVAPIPLWRLIFSAAATFLVSSASLPRFLADEMQSTSPALSSRSSNSSQAEVKPSQAVIALITKY